MLRFKPVALRGVGGVELSSAIFVSALSKADTQQEARLLGKTGPNNLRQINNFYFSQ